MKKTYLAAAVAAAMLPALASAEGLNYNYVDAGLAILDSGNQTFIGPDLRGSYSINEDVFLYGGLRILSDDLDYTNLYVGGAYRFGLDDKTDLWVGGNLEHQEVEVTVGPFTNSADDTAIALRGGMRHQLNSDLEVGANARIVLGDFDYFGFGGYGRYKMSDNLSLKGELDIQDGDLGLVGGITYFF